MRQTYHLLRPIAGDLICLFFIPILIFIFVLLFLIVIMIEGTGARLITRPA